MLGMHIYTAVCIILVFMSNMYKYQVVAIMVYMGLLSYVYKVIYVYTNDSFIITGTRVGISSLAARIGFVRTLC